MSKKSNIIIKKVYRKRKNNNYRQRIRLKSKIN